jgi:hypothetical protein
MARSGTVLKGSTNPDALRNRLINGDMSIAQRQVTFLSPANGTYTLDRWKYEKTATVTHSVTQDTDAPTLAQSGYNFKYSLRAALTSADTSIAAGDYCDISQKVEGYNFADLAGQVFTLSFWVKSTLAGTYCVAFQNSVADRSYVAEYVINAADTWEFKTVTVAASPSAGTWNYTNGIGLNVVWTLAAGSTYQTTANAWQAGNFIATANQVNAINTGVSNFRLTGCMLNLGAFPAQFRTFSNGGFEGEKAACMRYFEKSYNYGVYSGAQGSGYLAQTGTLGNVCRVSHTFAVQKRTTPSVSIFAALSGTPNAVSRDVAGDLAAGVQAPGDSGFSVEFSVPGSGDIRGYSHFLADAEL